MMLLENEPRVKQIITDTIWINLSNRCHPCSNFPAYWYFNTFNF